MCWQELGALLCPMSPSLCAMFPRPVPCSCHSVPCPQRSVLCPHHSVSHQHRSVPCRLTVLCHHRSAPCPHRSVPHSHWSVPHPCRSVPRHLTLCHVPVPLCHPITATSPLLCATSPPCCPPTWAVPHPRHSVPCPCHSVPHPCPSVTPPSPPCCPMAPSLRGTSLFLCAASQGCQCHGSAHLTGDTWQVTCGRWHMGGSTQGTAWGWRGPWGAGAMSHHRPRPRGLHISPSLLVTCSLVTAVPPRGRRPCPSRVFLRSGLAVPPPARKPLPQKASAGGRASRDPRGPQVSEGDPKPPWPQGFGDSEGTVGTVWGPWHGDSRNGGTRPPQFLGWSGTTGGVRVTPGTPQSGGWPWGCRGPPRGGAQQVPSAPSLGPHCCPMTGEGPEGCRWPCYPAVALGGTRGLGNRAGDVSDTGLGTGMGTGFGDTRDAGWEMTGTGTRGMPAGRGHAVTSARSPCWLRGNLCVPSVPAVAPGALPAAAGHWCHQCHRRPSRKGHHSVCRVSPPW
ncbi:translation initiation factor IF-2-like [Corvus cornix cornix]|uniref:translation initiation factor IF-2-like n=1 Tax=Corvus cornix cornix TaxID=932674 RepID=UPI00194E156E|nr:translation initiation factor IF-2-like [Corvus cornix cornix]